MTAIESGNKFIVRFDYNPEIVGKIKAIPGSRWYADQRCWGVPKYQKQRLQALLDKYGQIRQRIVEEPEQVGEIKEMPAASESTKNIIADNIKLPPYPYQMEGIEAGVGFKKYINGDSPGLGKTIQSIGTVICLDAFPCLVICPNTIKENWKREFAEKFSNKRCLILSDKTKNTWHLYLNHKMIDVIIVNYESLKKYFVKTINTPKGKNITMRDIVMKPEIALFKSIIIDESHKIKDGSTQQSKFVMLLAKGKEVVIALTGTPYVNRVSDLIPKLHTIDMLGAFGGYKRFMNRYCSGPNGESNLKELNWKLHELCYFRRNKEDVLKDLPPRVRQVISCEITNRTEYDKAKNDFVGYLKEVKNCDDKDIRRKLRGQFMVQPGILKSISAKGKLDTVYDWVDEIIESGQKVILFCTLREIGDAVIARYAGKVLEIRGGISNEERQRSVDRFQTDTRYQVILCSIKAAGVGLTLTAASDVGFIEFPWTDADCDQCESRAHRIGQKGSVRAAYFLGKRTVDKYCYDLIINKRETAKMISGQSEIDEESIDELINLFS